MDSIMINTDIDKLAAKIANNSLIKKNISPWVKQALTDFNEISRREMPAKSGKMARASSWRYDENLMESEVGIDDSVCPYAKWVYLGHASHKVHVKHEKSLQWFVSGRPVYAKSAIIPAKKANPFYEKIWARNGHNFINTIESGITQILGNIP